MKASKIWHCSCCDETINPGDEFKIIDGDILKIDHSMIGLDRPRNTEREAKPETDFMKSHFVVCSVTGPEPKKPTVWEPYKDINGQQSVLCNECKKHRVGRQCEHWDLKEDCPFQETGKAKAYREKIYPVYSEQLSLF